MATVNASAQLTSSLPKMYITSHIAMISPMQIGNTIRAILKVGASLSGLLRTDQAEILPNVNHAQSSVPRAKRAVYVLKAAKAVIAINKYKTIPVKLPSPTLRKALTMMALMFSIL